MQPAKLSDYHGGRFEVQPFMFAVECYRYFYQWFAGVMVYVTEQYFFGQRILKVTLYYPLQGARAVLRVETFFKQEVLGLGGQFQGVALRRYLSLSAHKHKIQYILHLGPSQRMKYDYFVNTV